jgi:hypothetical protein
MTRSNQILTQAADMPTDARAAGFDYLEDVHTLAKFVWHAGTF